MTSEEYAVTRYWVGRFRREIAECESVKDLDGASRMFGVHPLFARACLEASKGVLATLEMDLANEEAARAGVPAIQ
jgi:hypothetical protein